MLNAAQNKDLTDNETRPETCTRAEEASHARRPQDQQSRPDRRQSRQSPQVHRPQDGGGKARSRANSVKHGLTGAGIALPNEDAALVQEQFLIAQEQMAPATFLGANLVFQMSLMTVRRRRRAARQEAAHLARRVRHAEADFDEARIDHAEALLAAIEANPHAYRRKLLAMPEGVDLLVDGLVMLKSDLLGPAPTWTSAHHRRLDTLFGFRPDDLPRNRPTRFSRAVLGDAAAVGPDELAEVPADERLAWVVEQLMGTIDAEVARLSEHRATLDLAGVALDRSRAGEEALFDPGQEATLARRYEAAATWEFARAVRDFHLVEAAAGAEPEVEVKVEATQATTAEPPTAAEPKSTSRSEMGDDLGSCGGSMPAGLAAAACLTSAAIKAAMAGSGPVAPTAIGRLGLM